MKKEEIEQTENDLKAKKVKHNVITVFLDESDEDQTATFFLRKPDKQARKLIGGLVSKDPMEAIYAAIKNLWIAGDAPEIIKENDYAINSADKAVVKMLEVREATLKKN